MSNTTELAIGIIILAIVVSVGAVIMINYQEAVLITNSTSSSQNILADNNSAQTITPVEEGITSLSATRKNDSWLEFDGVNDIINTSYISPFNLTGNYSISAWIRTIKNSSVGSKIIEQWSQSGGEGNGYPISFRTSLVNNAKNLSMQIYNGTDGNTVISNTFIGDGIWHHFIGINNGSDLLLYLDGSFDNSNQITIIGDINSSEPILIGCQRTHGTCYTGGIDEVRIYNQSLTQTQISQIFNSGRQPNSSLPSDGLVLWYSFNEQTGTTVYDKSGNGNNGV